MRQGLPFYAPAQFVLIPTLRREHYLQRKKLAQRRDLLTITQLAGDRDGAQTPVFLPSQSTLAVATCEGLANRGARYGQPGRLSCRA